MYFYHSNCAIHLAHSRIEYNDSDLLIWFEPITGVHSTSDAGDGTVVINIGRNELRYSDLDTLQEGEWLNDCVSILKDLKKISLKSLNSTL